MSTTPSSSFTQEISEGPSHEYLVPHDSLRSLAGPGKEHRTIADARAALRNLLLANDPPIHAAATPGLPEDLSILARPDQQESVQSTLRHLGIPLQEGMVEHGQQVVAATIHRILDRKLQLTWKDAPHSLDFFVDRSRGSVIGILTIKKPKGTQTMRVDLAEVTVEQLAEAWRNQEENWKPQGDPVKIPEGNIFNHVRFLPLHGGRFLVWVVNHVDNAPDDRCFVASRVPSVSDVFNADGTMKPEYARMAA